MQGFEAWISDIGTNLNPSEITGEGYGIYLADAQRWIENDKRPRKRKARTIPPSTAEDATDPDLMRRLRERRRLEAAAKPSPYFDVTTITGKQENKGNAA